MSMLFSVMFDFTQIFVGYKNILMTVAAG